METDDITLRRVRLTAIARRHPDDEDVAYMLCTIHDLQARLDEARRLGSIRESQRRVAAAAAQRGED